MNITQLIKKVKETLAQRKARNKVPSWGEIFNDPSIDERLQFNSGFTRERV